MNTDTTISHISCAGYLPGFQYQEPSLRYRVGAHARVGDFNQQDCYCSYSSTHNQMDAVGSNEVAPTQVEGVSVMKQTSDSSQNVTTHFADDTIGYESSNLAVVSTSDRLVYELTAKSSQSIIDFLQRPAVMTNGNFTTADTGILWSADLSSVFTSIKIAKMNNIYTFKSDFQITLQVNADRFQQGRYMLCFLPYGGVNNHVTDSTQIPAWRRMHTCNLTKITQLPHVEIDLSTQTHVTLNIPFTSAFPMFSWSTTGAAMQQSNGLIFIIPYSPLATGTGGSTTCGYTVLGSLSNIKIGAASHAQADVGTNEAKAMGVGPVSGVLNRVSRATNVLGQLPVIGSLAANVSWFTRVIANSAAIMGFSKPMVVSAPTRMVRQVAIYNTVSDIAHTAKPLGMIAENSVAIPDNIPKNVDEMSFDFIKKVPAFVSEFSWNTSAVAGTLLFSESVSPRGSTGWSKGFAHAPVSFINLNFSRWRGGIEYNFKLVKTQFHRGRLMVAFFPGTTNGQNYANSETVFREIVDVSSTGAFKVCCPYMIPIPWSLSTASIGQIAVYVLDSLECPAAVSSTIRVLVEKSGADDLQWAVPIGVNYYEPYSPSTAQMAESYTETPCFTLGPVVSKPNDELTQFTTGEPIKSVRQLIKRIYTFSSGYVNIGATQIVQYYPYAVWPVTQAATTSGALQRDFSFSDFINLWACAYVFSYGSMRLFARAASGANQVVEASAINGLSTSRALYSGTGYDGSGVKSYTPLSIEGVVEVQAPNWNSTLARPTLSHFTNPVAGISMVEPNANCTNILIGDSIAAAAYQINLGRAAAEDYGFGMFIGVPPIVPIGST